MGERREAERAGRRQDRAAQRWSLACALLLTAAVGVLIAPTHPMVWGTQDPVTFAFGTLTTWHSWFDVLLLGYGALDAPVVVLGSIVAAVLAWLGMAQRLPRRSTAVWAGVAAAVALVGPAVLQAWQPRGLVAPLMLIAGALAAWLALRATIASPGTDMP